METFFLIFHRGAKIPKQKKKEIKKYPMRELEHSGITRVVILHLNLKSFGTRLIVIRLNLTAFKYYYFFIVTD